MITCKIGLIAFPRNNTKDCFLHLGELYDKTLRQDEDLLYDFHSKLRYLCPFKVLVKNGKIIPDNLEDLLAFQERYKLTRKVYSNSIIPDGTIKYLTPELYDIDCMVPLYKESPTKHLIDVKESKTIRVFILLPYTDPIIRGEIINNCINASKNKHFCFLVMGGQKGLNIRDSCVLTRRYLLSCGVADKDIILNQYDEFPDCIIEAVTIIDMFYEDTELFLGVSRDEIGKASRYVRLIHQMDMIPIKRRFQFICNN